MNIYEFPSRNQPLAAAEKNSMIQSMRAAKAHAQRGMDFVHVGDEKEAKLSFAAILVEIEQWLKVGVQ